MTSIPRARRPVLGIGLCLIFLLHLIFLITDGDAFSTGLIPCYIVLSNAPVAFLFPAFVLFSTTGPRTPRTSVPVPAPHVFDPSKPYFSVSYNIFHNDEQTLHNMAIGRPLNGTAKCVVTKVITRIDPGDFAASPFSGDDDAPIDARVYTVVAAAFRKPVPSRMLDLTAWGQVGPLQSRTIVRIRVRPRTNYEIVPTRAERDGIIRNSEQFAAIFKMKLIHPIVVGVFKAFLLIASLVALVVLYYLAPLVILCCVMFKSHVTFSSPTGLPIVKPADLYRAVSILAWHIAEEHWSGLKSVVVPLSAPFLRAIRLMRPTFVPECLLTPEEAKAFREDHKDSIPTPSVPPTLVMLQQENTFLSTPSPSPGGISFPPACRALNKRLNRNSRLPVALSSLSAFWAKVARAQSTLLSTPPTTVDAAQDPKIKPLKKGLRARRPKKKKITPKMDIPAHRILLPLQTRDELWLLCQGPAGRPRRKRPGVKTAASRTIPPNNNNGAFTASPHPHLTIDPNASVTPPRPTGESSGKGKNKQGPTPAPWKPSEHTDWGVCLPRQVTEEIFDESLLETPVPGCYYIASYKEKASQASNPRERRYLDVRPAAQVRGAGSCYWPLDIHPPPSATKNPSQASNPSGPRHSDVRPSAQVSGAGSYNSTPKPAERPLPAIVAPYWERPSSAKRHQPLGYRFGGAAPAPDFAARVNKVVKSTPPPFQPKTPYY